MRFPNPVAVPCTICGHPTVIAETSIGSLRVHCGTWHWQCKPLITAPRASSGTRYPQPLASRWMQPSNTK
jgi:hypothetical protein